MLTRAALWTLALSLAATPSSWAALDPELNKPYQVQVVVRVGKSRTLTPVFRQQLQRQLRDGIQAALGDMGEVEVIDMANAKPGRRPPLWDLIEKRGLQTALENFKEVSPRKTIFVLVDFVNNEYQIQTGQHDGMTGLSSPVVRTARTWDPFVVARIAGLMIDRDFGLVGTIDRPAENEVQVTLKGGGKGAPLERWVKKGEVFAIARISQSGGGLRSERVPAALLRVLDTPKGGVCRCRLVHRRPDPLASGPGVLGFRCLKLGTSKGRLQLRLVDFHTRKPIQGLQVTFSPDSYRDLDRTDDQAVTVRDGLVRSDKPYEHMAFVKVYFEKGPLAQVPVEILDDRPVAIPVSVKEGAEVAGQFDFRKDRWLNQLFDGVLTQAQLNTEIQVLVDKDDINAALAKSEAGLESLKNDLGNFKKELNALKAEAVKTPGVGFNPAVGEQHIRELDKQAANLQEVIARVKDAISKRDDPRKKEQAKRIIKGQKLENDADFAGAIEEYKAALKEGPENPELEKKLAKLIADWKPKNEEHAKARAFIYQEWAKLDTAERMQAQLEPLRQSWKICLENGDRMTAKKLGLAIIKQTAQLGKLKGGQKAMVEDDEAAREAKRIEEVSNALQVILKEVTEFVQAAKK